MFFWKLFNNLLTSWCFQLEDVEVTVADHVQKVMKPNFAASWDEVGEENELEDTYALSTMKTLEGTFTHNQDYTNESKIEIVNFKTVLNASLDNICQHCLLLYCRGS